MTKYSEIFQSLNEVTSLDTARFEFIAFLKTEAEHLRAFPQDTIDIAYRITGMIATNSAQLLERPHGPIDEVLTIAGELEIDPPKATELRSELLAKIDTL